MPTLSRLHVRRLREVWRSAGWPCQDGVEAELLAAGLLERLREADGRERLRVTDAGVAALAQGLARNRAALGPHEALVARVAAQMQRAGRVVYTGLMLRAPLAGDVPDRVRWVQARPDVFSIRHTTREDALQPVVHEIKVRRADLLADLRLPDKRAAYLALAGECWYVLAEGIGEPGEVPPECGVMIAGSAGLEVARPAPARALKLPFDTWMALARAVPLAPPDDDGQRRLGDEQAD
ncbi:hypothetical protein [Caldimonas tepidiphila]|uniref:hypothetical protein n=1 Tax=Caldimonas tepidiphila TaxID=2315841 RepID=UPI000E5BBF8F|nr:hypothetical protein [Caldimonas tepidiphila]